jgi:MSHA pilin protein MshD
MMHRAAGATLIELIVSVVVISITVTGIMMVIARTAGSSGDPLIRMQAIAIAESYMEEILAQALLDPAGGDVGAAEAGETRATFDDVTDYHNLLDDAGAVDQMGSGITGLEGYNVAVSVGDTVLNGDPAKRIQVTVTFDGDPNFSFPLAAYRLN